MPKNGVKNFFLIFP